MIVTCCLIICVFAVLINRASLQVTVEGVIGSSVVLPCSSTEDDKIENINVKWRHNNSENVFDVINGKDSVAGQNPRYKDRAKTFPDEYKKRNFSLKLKDLQHTDAGTFICLISHASEHQNVLLLLKELRAEKGNSSTGQENQEGTSPGSEETSQIVIVVVVVVLVSVILCVLFVFYFFVVKHMKNRTVAVL